MPSKKKSRVAKDVSIPTKKERDLEKKPGGSNTGKYKTVAKSEFAGKAGGTSPYSFPINTLARARNALARAHFAPDPEGIRRKVYAMYPELKERAEKREGKNNGRKKKK